MLELEQDDPIPQGDLALQITALPRETNGFGDIYGGWLVSQMDLAGTAMASKIAGGRVATVAIDRMAFLVPVAVGAQLSFYTQALDVGRSSIQMMVEVWSDDPLSSEWRKVTEAVFVFVAIDGSGRTRPVPERPGYQDRTLDLDLLLFDDRVIHTGALILPHPRMHERLFVLAPLAEIAPAMVHPLLCRPVAGLLQDLQQADPDQRVERLRWPEPPCIRL